MKHDSSDSQYNQSHQHVLHGQANAGRDISYVINIRKMPINPGPLPGSRIPINPGPLPGSRIPINPGPLPGAKTPINPGPLPGAKIPINPEPLPGAKSHQET